jgi:flagellar protein FliJ
MARFLFKLEGVLRHRLNIERQRQREHALLQSQMQQLQGQLRDLDQAMSSATADLRDNQLVGRLDMNFIAAHRRFMVAIRQQGSTLFQKMAALQKQVDQSRAALSQAAIQRKIMEKLREKQHQRWRAELERREAAELEEVGAGPCLRNLPDPRGPGPGGQT